MKLQRNALYGDGFFESIAVVRGKILLAQYHWNRIVNTAGFLKIDLQNELSSFDKFLVLCQSSVDSKYDFRIRLDIYRSGKGRYKPETNLSSFHVSFELLKDVFSCNNNEGKQVGICKSIHVYSSPLRQMKLIGNHTQILAAIEAQNNNWEDALLVNKEGKVIEAIASNVFFINFSGEIITPPLESGALDGVMRRFIMTEMRDEYSIHEKEISLSELSTFESCFLTNAVQGVVIISNIEENLYLNNRANLFKDSLLRRLLTK